MATRIDKDIVDEDAISMLGAGDVQHWLLC